MSKPRNFEELITFTNNDQSLSFNKRKSRRSHLKRFCEAVGHIPTTLAADIPIVRDLMSKANPGASGISQQYWATIRSGVWGAMEAAGFPIVRARGVNPTPHVQSLVAIIGDDGDKTQLALTPILKFFVMAGTSPWEFSQKTVPLYRKWLNGCYSRTNWQRAYTRSIGVWTMLQTRFPYEWPQHPVSAQFDVDDFYYPNWDVFPDLRNDYDNHLKQIAANKPRRYGKDRKILNPLSLKAREDHVRRFASAVARAHNMKPHEVISLEFITRPEVVDETVNLLMERFGSETNGGVYQTLRHINSIARHHVKRDEEELEELMDIRASVAPPNGPADKNVALVQLFRDPELREKFAGCAGEILRELKRKKRLTPGDVKRGMLAFLAGILTKIPMRISEVLALKYGETFFDAGAGNTRKVAISLPAEMVKNNEPRRALFGPELVRLYDIYITVIRPHLAPASNPYLFPSGPTAARNDDHISHSLAAMMHREIGVRMTAHQFRHVVGYIFLVAKPGCYDTVRRLLGHRSLKTTLRFYAFVLEDEAHELLDETIDDLAAKRNLRRRRRAA